MRKEKQGLKNSQTNDSMAAGAMMDDGWHTLMMDVAKVNGFSHWINNKRRVTDATATTYERFLKYFLKLWWNWIEICDAVNRNSAEFGRAQIRYYNRQALVFCPHSALYSQAKWRENLKLLPK
jgi:hypothetical protein